MTLFKKKNLPFSDLRRTFHTFNRPNLHDQRQFGSGQIRLPDIQIANLLRLRPIGRRERLSKLHRRP